MTTRTATLVPDAGATLADSVLTPDRIRAEALLALPDAGWIEDDDSVDEFANVDPDYDRDALAAWIVDLVTAQASAAYAAGLAAATAAEDAEFGRVAEMATAAGDAQASGVFAEYLGQLATVLRRGHTLTAQHDLARTLDAESARLRTHVATTLAAYPALRATVAAPSLVLPADNV